MKLFVEKTDFVSPYPVLSENTNKSSIEPYIFKAINENLRQLLGDTFFESLNNDYQITSNIQGLTVGNTTLITLDMPLQVSSFVTLQGLTGTIANSANSKEFQIIGVNGNIIEINLNSTGLTYISGGYIERYKTLANYNLLNIAKPYLIYNSFAKYLPYSSLKNTNSGQVLKSLGEATLPSDSHIGRLVNAEIESSDFYEKKLIEYINSQKTNYPLYVSEGYINTQFSSVIGLRSNGVRTNQGYNF